MARPRSELISLSDTTYYHCVSRCVRRAFLCGTDHYSGQSYEHRRDWLEKKLLYVANVFAIKVCAYAIMSNHYHVVLSVRTDIASEWSPHEVAHRWHRLFKGTALSARFLNGETFNKEEEQALVILIELWRERLTNISWLMRIVNESIARRANNEDECTGSFWESRFKSQALLGEKALISCMAYVDLNPIRAGVATLPESSEFTSIKQRITGVLDLKALPACLEHFVGGKADVIGVPYTLKDYIDLVEWTGRMMRSDKRGFMSEAEPDILNRFNMDIDDWYILTTEFESRFSSWVGSEQMVHDIYKKHRYRRRPSTAEHRHFFA